MILQKNRLLSYFLLTTALLMIASCATVRFTPTGESQPPTQAR